MLKLLLFPVLVLLLGLFNALNTTNLLFVIFGCILFYYLTDFLFKNKKDPFQVQSKSVSVLIALVFFSTIFFLIYYIWVK